MRRRTRDGRLFASCPVSGSVASRRAVAIPERYNAAGPVRACRASIYNAAIDIYFEALRRRRERHYASYDPAHAASKRSAVVTIVHNEAVFFPIWLEYYSRFFAADDIYVLDHETSDGSTSRPGFNRIPVECDRVDHVWMVETVQKLQHELFDRYDAVLVTDVDEIVVPDPRWGTLGEYVKRLDEEFVTCRGFEIVHMPREEGPFDPGRPVLDQRGYWFANGAYDKPILATVPMEWKPGFHQRVDERMNYDPDLYLVHLHRMDYATCLERHRLRQRREWNDRDLAEEWALHNLIVEQEEFDRWFFEDSGFEQIPMEISPIPSHWRRAF